MRERPKPPPMHIVEKGLFARGELDPVTREPLHPGWWTKFLRWLFAKPQHQSELDFWREGGVGVDLKARQRTAQQHGLNI
jgi:hypothetical protein